MSIKKRYIVGLTEAQIRFIKFMIHYAEYEMMDGCSFEQGILYGSDGDYKWGNPKKREANLRDSVHEACDKVLENGLKTLKL